MTAPFKLGDRVEHTDYGAGTVVEVLQCDALSVFWDKKRAVGEPHVSSVRKLRTEEEKRAEIYDAATRFVTAYQCDGHMSVGACEALEKLREALK